MCGFAGIIDFERRTGEQAIRAIVDRMANALRHRGPDDAGTWVDTAAGVALGHRRLSILDLSPAGHQPMVSASGRHVIVFNGEIYNSPQLRRELEQVTTGSLSFRGHSDTEVMLAAFEHWGVQQAISRMNGMFAFALWNRLERVLYLGRDRLGEKPVYYGWAGKTFLFGSELKAHPDFQAAIDRQALALYLRHNCIPAPHSIYKGVHKLPPATILAVPTNAVGAATPEPYWSLKEVAERAIADPFSGSEQEALREFEILLRDAVKIRMLADVPLGAFLSGGVDSSTVVALMQAQSEQPVKTFTIGSCERDYNEAGDARAVARHLGTEHTELYVTPAEAMDVIPRLPEIYDEPFADSSQIPTFLVAQLARQHVTVSLSGDGGDEVLGGYNRHVWNDRIWKSIRWAPQSIRMATARAIRRIPPDRWELLARSLSLLLPRNRMHRHFGYKLHKFAGILPARNPEAIYFALASHWPEPESVVLHAKEPETLLTRADARAHLPEFVQQMMFLDTATYLPDDILAKVDRATMAVSLEARVPLLDHRVVEFAWRLPISLKIRNGQGKWILRRLLHRYVPPELIDRPKAGFGIPLDTWLRGPLRDWAESLLDANRLRSEGFFNPQPILEKWNDHLAGNGTWQYHLWDVLMFQAWYSAQRQSKPELEYSARGVSCASPLSSESGATGRSARKSEFCARPEGPSPNSSELA
jgi:asparagine synthase (glutamine-hydrolysing)